MLKLLKSKNKMQRLKKFY